MMHDTHFAVTAEEARKAWGPDYHKYYLEEAGGYQAEYGVALGQEHEECRSNSHQTRCLPRSSLSGAYHRCNGSELELTNVQNWMRKVIHPDEYPSVARDRISRGEGHTSESRDLTALDKLC